MTAGPNFNTRRGGEAAASTANASFSRTEFFSIDDGETAHLRFLTDYTPTETSDGGLIGGWLTLKQHQNVPTRGKPNGWKGENWPSHMAAPCRYDEPWQGVYDDCYICDQIKPRLEGSSTPLKNPSPRTWALAVLREEVREGKKIVGYRDKTRKVKIDEKEVTEPAIIVLNMGWKNFFANIDGFGSHYTTVLDRDYAIIRRGSGLETVYTVIPCDPCGIDLRNDDEMAKYLPEAAEVGGPAAADGRLVKILLDRTSDKFYNTFFVDGAAIDTDSDDTVTETPADAPKAPSGDAPPELANLVSRLGVKPPAEEDEEEGVGAASPLRNFG
jgi:hypothetical protein